MGVGRPGTIGPQHPARTFSLRGAKPALAGGGKKPQAACCGFKIEVTPASPVFGQTPAYRGRDGRGLRQADRRNSPIAAIGTTLSLPPPRASLRGPDRPSASPAGGSDRFSLTIGRRQ